MVVRQVIALSAAAVVCASALASHPITTMYGHEFVTVGAPGNAPIVLPQINGIGPLTPIGAVDRTFRVTRNEVTRGQWLGFLDAYRPYLTLGEFGGMQFTGGAAQYAGIGPDGLPQYQVLSPQLANNPVTPSWTYVARFMNWMHNGAKPIHEATYDDFHTGAYNMNDFGTATPVVRQEGARFFMMDYDEWTKAVYYDPDRFGEGQGGYWLYPDASNTPLVQGPPPPDGNGETSGGYAWGGIAPPPVGAYGIETPWGLLDASGGAREWLEAFGDQFPTGSTLKPLAGSWAGSSANGSEQYDQIGWLLGSNPALGLNGFRIATVIPVPPAGAMLVGAMAFVARRRR